MYQVNFLPWRARLLRIRYRFWRNLLLAQSMVMIIGACALWGLWRSERQQQQATLVTLLQQQTNLAKTYQDTQQAITQLQQLKSLQQTYQNVQWYNQRYLTLLQQLSALIPDQCWITMLENNNHSLIFNGICHNYAAIITFLQALNKNANLRNIRLNDVSQQEGSHLHFATHAEWKSETPPVNKKDQQWLYKPAWQLFLWQWAMISIIGLAVYLLILRSEWQQVVSGRNSIITHQSIVAQHQQQLVSLPRLSVIESQINDVLSQRKFQDVNADILIQRIRKLLPPSGNQIIHWQRKTAEKNTTQQRWHMVLDTDYPGLTSFLQSTLSLKPPIHIEQINIIAEKNRLIVKFGLIDHVTGGESEQIAKINI